MIKAVINSAKYEALPDDVKSLYTFNSNGTYYLDLDMGGLSEHPNVAKVESAYQNKIDEIQGERDSLIKKVEELAGQNTDLITEGNQRLVSNVVQTQLSNFDLSEGRDKVISRLLQPTITQLLNEEGGDLNQKDVEKVLKRELDSLRRTSPTLLPDKIDEPTLEIGAKIDPKINTPIKGSSNEDEVDYDNFDGNIEEIDYQHFMKNYINKED